MNARALLLPLLLVLSAPACKSAYYGVMESFGVEKREILAGRVEDGRDAQREAKESFESALEAFKGVTGFQGGDLEQAYRRLKSEYGEAEDRVADVADRIDSIEAVAGDLFEEWQAEIRAISSANLRGRSEAMLSDTRARYESLIGAMRKAEAKMKPVLVAFNDRVLFLKHNLNAQAIAALGGEVAEIDAQVAALVRDMEASIAEAESFLAALEPGGAQ